MAVNIFIFFYYKNDIKVTESKAICYNTSIEEGMALHEFFTISGERYREWGKWMRSEK